MDLVSCLLGTGYAVVQNSIYGELDIVPGNSSLGFYILDLLFERELVPHFLHEGYFETEAWLQYSVKASQSLNYHRVVLLDEEDR